MRRWVVDTNVPIVANGRPDPADPRPPSLACREAAIDFLQAVLRDGRILLDANGDVEAEYHRYLSPRGQPGVGDRFYLEVINSAPRRVERTELPRRPDGEYAHLPQALIDAGFDPSDRKFAALAKRARATVANAVDSDWLDHRPTLQREGIRLHFVCGCTIAEWFE
jgi:hypothetical protein